MAVGVPKVAVLMGISPILSRFCIFDYCSDLTNFLRRSRNLSFCVF